MHRQRTGEVDWGAILLILVVAGFVTWFVYNDSKVRVAPRFSGRIEQPFFGVPKLVITAWHQHPGVLHNGVLQVTIFGAQALDPRGYDTKSFSFESWEPNQDHAVTLEFPLRDEETTQEIPLQISLSGNRIHPWSLQDTWIENGWKSNQK